MEKARRERNRALIVPREHGAWGLLLVPMVTAAGVAFRQSTNVFPFVLLLTAALALFWLRTPLESLLGISAMRAETKEERGSVAFVVLYLVIVAGLASSMLLWAGQNPLLWLIGAAAGAGVRRAGSATQDGPPHAHAFRNCGHDWAHRLGACGLLRDHRQIRHHGVDAVAGESYFRGQSDPLRADQNSYGQARRCARQARARVDLRGWDSWRWQRCWR